MNSYGVDCNEVCSIDNRMCRGMLMCTQFECSCPAGLTGPLCNEGIYNIFTSNFLRLRKINYCVDYISISVVNVPSALYVLTK